ncbi:MAG TPA: peptidyl-prolyl cis-trans isomerase [Vicinamibacterales bacterium]|nr:peptidyl-prolyl cis-trans isomerase [Vicinamibacterales bacterium]
MTMLDRMRRHKAWLKWSLGLVVVTFILLYVPSFMDPVAGNGTSPNDPIATVEGRNITVGTFQRAYQQQVMQVRQSYGGQLNEDMMRQLQIPQRVVQQLVDEEATVAAANQLGMSVSDAELRERIVRMPGFQQNGAFIGDTRYRQVLANQRPPLRPADFEDQLRKGLLSEKLQGAVTAWIQVSDAEAESEYRKQNEKVKLELAIFTASKFSSAITPTDADINAQFAANQGTYRSAEKRRVRYLSIDAEALKATRTVTPAEVEARYRQSLAQFTTPEMVRASHILFKTGAGKDEAAQRKAAESVLVKAKAGEDFAALAKKYSEDSSAPQGGDLDFFPHERMTKVFSDAAFAMKPGQVSDIVKSEFGFHIIKTTDRKAGGTQPLESVRAQIEDQMKFEKAQAEAQSIADQAAKEIDDPSDLDTVAKARNLTVSDSGLFSREEPLLGLGFAPAVSAAAFTMEQGKVSGQLRTNQGFAFIALTEIKPPAIPALAEVKDRVRADVARIKAVELAKTKAAEMAQAAQRGTFAAAAKASGADLKTTELISRGTAYPEVGVNSALDEAAFRLPEGGTSGPISTESAVVVAHVIDRADVAPETLAKEKLQVSSQLMQQRRQEFFTAYMAKAKQKMKITFNEAAIKTLFSK